MSFSLPSLPNWIILSLFIIDRFSIQPTLTLVFVLNISQESMVASSIKSKQSSHFFPTPLASQNLPLTYISLTSMFDTAILKGIYSGHFRSTLDTEMFCRFTTVHHERYPADRPKHEEKTTAGGPCFPRGCGCHTRPRFLIANGTLRHHHGKTRYHWVASIIIGCSGTLVVLWCRSWWCTAATPASTDSMHTHCRGQRSSGLGHVGIRRFFRNECCHG